MPIQNDFLPFAAGSGANVLTQAQYAALTSLIANGFSAGVAPSAQLNKVWRQGGLMAAVLAQFIVANTGQTAIDDGTTATLLANLATAISVTARQNPVLADTGAANAYVVSNLAAFTAYPTSSGLTLDVSIANANTGASTLNVDGLGAKPILGLGLQPLQGGELVAKGVACLLYVVASTVNGENGAWVVMECSGGAQQVAPATQSQHAVSLGQFLSSLSAGGYIKIPTAGGPLILQWGSLTPTGGAQTASLPIAFPNNNFAIVGQFSTSVDAEFGYVNISGVGLTQYRVVVRDSSGALLSKQVRWFAIGN
ncbi:hypothetical protein BKK81_12165 [Cupriavidus sp. USMAHM13]|uniref:gp53-like domain-containing protein n=1 Tax=Cupriavidus sp. USMAHM13 TaxID=1389192 RepID=UPI0008A6D64D|nr:hypothetical protein [Cupriavidus sp. USMAHM13]AOY99915.1 hypothetical protein BKK81_12165 [Cupriavidus sp. USMAHM13]